ncbi:MAG: glycosyltransferase, partial [Ottowia sp.]|nr:glycosyltransferase [Ottowia sp.]
MATNRRYKLSIIIPVYGSELVLPELVSQIHAVLTQLEEIRESYEIIFVCDCSPDHSWQVIQTLSAKYPQVRGILLRMNAGQHNALMAGFAKAQGEIIVTMD